MIQHTPTTVLVAFPCNSSGRTADRGFILNLDFNQIYHNNDFFQGGFYIIPLISF